MTAQNLPKRFFNVPAPSMETAWYKVKDVDVNGMWINIHEGYQEVVVDGNTDWHKVNIIKITFNVIREDLSYQKEILLPGIFFDENKLCLLDAVIKRGSKKFKKDLGKTITFKKFEWVQVGVGKSNGYYFFKTGMKLDICLTEYYDRGWVVSLTTNHDEVELEETVAKKEDALERANEFYRRMFCTHPVYETK